MANVAALLIAPLKLGLWLSIAGGGLYLGWKYEATPGTPAAAIDWPKSSALARDASRPTVLMFIHPACPCTGASLDGLAQLLSTREPAAKLVVFVVGAKGLATALEDGPNVKLARSISGALVVSDPDAAESIRFGAVTSGQTLVFSPEGTLLFRGGLTTSRGHAGPSRGLDALDAILLRGSRKRVETPVYGCALRNKVL